MRTFPSHSTSQCANLFRVSHSSLSSMSYSAALLWHVPRLQQGKVGKVCVCVCVCVCVWERERERERESEYGRIVKCSSLFNGACVCVCLSGKHTFFLREGYLSAVWVCVCLLEFTEDSGWMNVDALQIYSQITWSDLFTFRISYVTWKQKHHTLSNSMTCGDSDEAECWVDCISACFILYVYII